MKKLECLLFQVLPGRNPFMNFKCLAERGKTVVAHQEAQFANRAVQSVESQGQLPQMTLFGSQMDPNVETLLNKLDASGPERMTPIEAMLLLSELKRLVK